LICTAENLPELVTGYLYNEGLISSLSDILEYSGDRDSATVRLAGCPDFGDEVRPSGLGGVQLCSSRELPLREIKAKYSLEYIVSCASLMDSHAEKYGSTGGLHCSALFDGEKMLELGHGPIMAEVIDATISLKTSRGDKLKVWGVNAQGFYAGQLSTAYENGVLTFRVGDEDNPAPYYLIVED
ncbi:MAG: formate dehydrogenase accessory sulfurtransferase FdhD, partial [Clostridia bacterium]|nr:formate dehydrogenase accessory sulfurtransferase FdhD [Clostridia bacterium]